MLIIGYVYDQAYSVEDEKTHQRKTGVTRYALVHRLDNAGVIQHTTQYKVAKCFDAVAGTFYDSEPYFDRFGKLAGFFGEGAQNK